ncbi:hypothetical protein M8J77_008931 [Diaphorina citri]|nr:hypothetical protein M8J77_008931 [Diaphorina citri]
MALNALPKLESVNFNHDDLKDFQRRFNLYLLANSLDNKEEKVKVAYLRLGLPAKINDILDKFSEVNLTVSKVFQELKDNFLPETNTCFAQFQFFGLEQKEDTFMLTYPDSVLHGARHVITVDYRITLQVVAD